MHTILLHPWVCFDHAAHPDSSDPLWLLQEYPQRTHTATALWDSSCWSSYSVPSQLCQLAVATVVLFYVKPMCGCVFVGVEIGRPLGQLSSKFSESPQNVDTKSPNGPWKCWLISIPDVQKILKNKIKVLKKLRALNFLIPGAQMALQPAFACQLEIYCRVSFNSTQYVVEVNTSILKWTGLF